MLLYKWMFFKFAVNLQWVYADDVARLKLSGKQSSNCSKQTHHLNVPLQEMSHYTRFLVTGPNMTSYYDLVLKHDLVAH